MLKQIAIIVFFCGMLFNTKGQKPGESFYDGHVSFVSTDNQGSLTVKSTGNGKKTLDMQYDAERSAIYVLLFRGVAGSPYSVPMINDENANKDKKVIVDLLDDGYHSFIISSILLSKEKKNKKADGEKGQEAVYTITINCDALRKYLEQNNIIRKFGI